VSEDGLEALEHQLRGPAPSGLTRLSPAELTHLAGAIQAARQRQAAELEAAGEQALSLVPRLLRGPIRRLVG
jgi:hypothetical protein